MKGHQFLFQLVILVLSYCPVYSQQLDHYVDQDGIIRNGATGEELHGFGINYTVPFAHAYRSAMKMGVDPYKAIDQDVYHFARLGLNLYRVHVWDTEISDSLGNILNNEHLKLFDYLLHQLAKRKIKYILTPIAFWGNGWPEPDEATPGFSQSYGKDRCLTDPDAILAQQNYLGQFMEHINPYTGVVYKNDPNLIAIEISNEPHHRAKPDEVTEFIIKMVASIRRTDCKKPVFYNISHSVQLAENYFAAGIDGGTFQWYPTGLGYQQELPGNFLPNVDQYLIPFDSVIQQNAGAKIVYEFDAADLEKSYLYPAMARSFRKAGIQLANHFSYDPTYLAPYNTEYNTHYMNLAYAPHKALALMICREIFEQIPLYADFGRYPGNTSFGHFLIDPFTDLAMLNDGKHYYYTNSTDLQPLSPLDLKSIAGHGNSTVIQYDGTGAYFLDRLEPGVWRLEVMPDPIIFKNPFGRNSLKKQVAAIQWNHRKMKIILDELGTKFEITGLNAGNNYRLKTEKNEFNIRPGTYLIKKDGKTSEWNGLDSIKTFALVEFVAPAENLDKIQLVSDPTNIAIEGTDIPISIQLASPYPIKKVLLTLMNNFRSRNLEMEQGRGFEYQTTIPAEWVKPGHLEYFITVEGEENTHTFPAGLEGRPFDWDFFERTGYPIRVLKPNQPVPLFETEKDWRGLSYSHWPDEFHRIPGDEPGQTELQILINQLGRPDPENTHVIPRKDYTISYFLPLKLDVIKKQFPEKRELIFRARSLQEENLKVQIALTDKNGLSYGTVLELGPSIEDHRIQLDSLIPVKTVLMPRAYPTFLPYFFENSLGEILTPEAIQSIQIRIGPELTEKQKDENTGIGIVGIFLK